MNVSDYKVLLVDDNSMTLNLVSTMLRSNGFMAIETALDGRIALEKIAEKEQEGNLYDIVFLDWNMPEVGGYEVLRQCRENRSYDNMAIVMLTAENQKRYMLEAIKIGATSYIVKPLAQDDLEKKLKQILEWFEAKRAG